MVDLLVISISLVAAFAFGWHCAKKTIVTLEASSSTANLPRSEAERNTRQVDNASGDTSLAINRLIDVMNEMVIVVSDDGIIQSLNQSSCTHLGYRDQDLVGQNLALLFFGSDGNALQIITVRKLIHLDSIEGIERTFVTASDTRLPVLFSCAPLRDDHGQTQAIVCVAQNISQLKKVEDKLLSANDELKSLNQELQNTQLQLVQSAKLASIGEISAGLAHELNQPLGAILLSAEMIDELLNDQPERYIQNIRDSIKRILANLKRASALITHLKTFSRSDGDKEFSDVDINWVIQESLILFEQPMRIAGIDTRLELNKDLPRFCCNVIKIEQVITNLLANARDAVMDKEQKLIKVRSFMTEKSIVIEVEDNGCGIPRELVNKVFDPFFTTKEVGKGTGLGMSISYGIVREHSGNMEVTSVEGEGSVFRLSLPLVA